MAAFTVTGSLCLIRSNTKQISLKHILTPRLHSDPHHLRCPAASATQFPVSLPESQERRSANYQQTIWSYDFLQSLENEHFDMAYKGRAAKLEQELRFTLYDEDADSLYLLELIDDIQRLGLTHRFDKDIHRVLKKLVTSEKYGVATEQNDLHAVALRFRLLRQNGFQISQDVFKEFMDEKGNFKEGLAKDVKGILSLYEASHLAHETEDLMGEALTFSRFNLQSLKVENYLSEQVKHALELPLHRRMLRLEARWYIEAYTKMANANRKLLELAKLDFNIVQSILQKDIQGMSRWWMDMGLQSKLSFARDRIVECFFWMVGMVSVPQLTNCGKGLTKVASLVTIIDDVYDVYGTLEELELLTDAVQRWDVSAVKNLPGYMKLCFLALFNTVNGMAYETLRDHGENSLPYLTKAWADLCKAFLQEAKWSHSKITPSFQDYIENGWMSVSGVVFLVHAYFLESPNISNKALQSLENYHDHLRWPSLIFRLCNDLGTSKDEIERGETANSIICYMKETGCSDAVARQYIRNLIDQCWKKLNKTQIDGSPFGNHLVETAINLARISHCTYQHGDAHGCPDSKSKDRVVSLIIEPISIDENVML